MPRDSNRTFILGLGHQKCGTSWLYRYLCSRANFAQGITKEYHVWDALDAELATGFRQRYHPEQSQYSRRNIIHAMQNNTSLYFDYFVQLMLNGFNLSADITPLYCLLDRQRLAKIQAGFNQRNINVKVVILVRNPAERIASAVRFNLQRENFQEGIRPGEHCFSSALEQYITSQHCQIRTLYQNAIIEAEQVFDRQDIYVGFYEEMFNAPQITALSDFLGVAANPEFATVKINSTPRNKGSLDNSERSKIRQLYASVYDYFFARFPHSRTLWS